MNRAFYRMSGILEAKKLFAVAGALLFGSILAFLIGEVAIRIVPHAKVSTVMWKPDKIMGAVLKPNQRTRFSHKEFYNVVRTNSHGYHDFEHEYKKPEGVFRILVVGDSYVEGLHVKRNELFFTILSKKLNDEFNIENSKSKYEVISLARSGWGTAQELKCFKEYGLRYKPDLVILCFLPGNDFFNSYKPLMKDTFRPYYTLHNNGNLVLEPANVDIDRNSFIYKVYKKSQLVCFLKQNLRPLLTKNNTPKVPLQFGIYAVTKTAQWQKAISLTLACIREFNIICQKNDIIFLCANIASQFLVEKMDLQNYYKLYPEMARHEYDFHYPYTLLDDFCRDNSIAYAFMLDYFRQDFIETKKNSYFQHEGHWNKYGHHLAADFFYSYLRCHPGLITALK